MLFAGFALHSRAMRDGNWIDGAWCGSGAGDGFEVVLRGVGDAGREWWPRSTPDDLVRALQGLERGGGDWRALGRSARAGVLADVLDSWQDEPDDFDALARCLGFGVGELDDHLEAALEAGDRCLEAPASREAAEDPRPLLVRARAGEFLAGPVRAALPALLEGRALLFLSDPDLPALTRDFVAQLSSDERLAGAVALLHEDRNTCLAVALASEAFTGAHAPGTRKLALSVPRGAPTLPAAASRPPVGVRASFGSGILDREVRSASGRRAFPVEDAPLSDGARAVFFRDDPAEAAQRIALLAFDPVASLSGQLEGQVGRVMCHERHFSHFTEALLEELEELRSRPACPSFTSGLRSRCAQLRRLGLDEGATLVLDGLERSAGFREGSREAILAPSVFTNVEPTMGVARASEPAPVLSLLRAESDAEARAWLAARPRGV